MFDRCFFTLVFGFAQELIIIAYRHENDMPT